MNQAAASLVREAATSAGIRVWAVTARKSLKPAAARAESHK